MRKCHLEFIIPIITLLYQPFAVALVLAALLLLLFSLVGSFRDSSEVLLETAPSSSVFSPGLCSPAAAAAAGVGSSAEASSDLPTEPAGEGAGAGWSALVSAADLSASTVERNRKK